MKKLKLFVLLISFSVGYSQSLETNKNTDLYKNAPEWAKLMFSIRIYTAAFPAQC